MMSGWEASSDEAGEDPKSEEIRRLQQQVMAMQQMMLELQARADGAEASYEEGVSKSKKEIMMQLKKSRHLQQQTKEQLQRFMIEVADSRTKNRILTLELANRSDSLKRMEAHLDARLEELNQARAEHTALRRDLLHFQSIATSITRELYAASTPHEIVEAFRWRPQSLSSLRPSQSLEQHQQSTPPEGAKRWQDTAT